jgi:hypothetical protein
MFCAFDGPPRIVRLHGRASVVTAGEDGFEALCERAGFVMPEVPELRRAVIVASITRIADSCGYGVPLMSYEGLRPHQGAWAAKKVRVGGVQALADYQREKNSVSIDGLPAVSL